MRSQPRKLSKLTLVLSALIVVLVGWLVWPDWKDKVPRPGTTVLTVGAEPQQTLKGWGIYPGTYQMERPDPGRYHIFNRPNAQRLIFKELGASFIRCSIYPNSYDSKKDDGSLDTKYIDAGLVRHLKMAASYGHHKYLLTVWSPPKAFKDPPSHLGVDPKTKYATKLRKDREEDYCRYVVKVLDYLTKVKGLPAPIAYSVQNEPDVTPDLWDGTLYDGVQWRRVTTAMRRVLDAGGYKNVRLIGPDCSNYHDSLDFIGASNLGPLEAEPDFAKAFSGWAFHGYGYYPRFSPDREQMRATALKLRALKKDVWMTEWSVTEPGISRLDHALTVSQRLGMEMTYIPVDYWTWWQGWYNQHPKGEVLITGIDDNKLHISQSYYFLQKLWHLAPAGSVVHKVTSNDWQISGFHDTKVQTVAFKTGSRTTLMVVNPTSWGKSARISNTDGKTLQHYLTTENADMALQPTTLGEVHLPARSISLLTWIG